MTLVAWAGSEPGIAERRLAAAALVNTGLGDLISESLVVRTPSRLDRARQEVGRLLLSASVPIPKSPTPISSRILRHFVLGPEATPAQVAFCERMVLGSRREVRAACGATLSQLDLMESVESLDVPTAVVAGERDRLTPPAHAERLAEALPQLASYEELPGVGHMAPVEAPQAVSERIAELVGEFSPRAVGTAG
jgi:pimeloyl-ACP methyl ester carboxylesterase